MTFGQYVLVLGCDLMIPCLSFTHSYAVSAAHLPSSGPVVPLTRELHQWSSSTQQQLDVKLHLSSRETSEAKGEPGASEMRASIVKTRRTNEVSLYILLVFGLVQ